MKREIKREKVKVKNYRKWKGKQNVYVKGKGKTVVCTVYRE